jgi:hypothetical protein
MSVVEHIVFTRLWTKKNYAAPCWLQFHALAQQRSDLYSLFEDKCTWLFYNLICLGLG